MMVFRSTDATLYLCFRFTFHGLPPVNHRRCDVKVAYRCCDTVLLIVLEDVFYLSLTPTFTMFARIDYKLGFPLTCVQFFIGLARDSSQAGNPVRLTR